MEKELEILTCDYCDCVIQEGDLKCTHVDGSTVCFECFDGLN